MRVAFLLLFLICSLVACRDSQIPDGNTTEHIFRIDVGAEPSIKGDAVYRVNVNDSVTMSVTSDTSGEIHIHGYGLKKLVEPAIPANLTFQVKATGRFDVEIHFADSRTGNHSEHAHDHSETRSEVKLGVLEVYPR